MKKEYRCVAKTRGTIRKAFVELLGEKRNMERITVSEIVRKANIAKSTFYNHYDDVYSVVEEFENELIEELGVIFDEMKKSDKSEYEDYIRRLNLFIKSNEEIYKKLLNSPDSRYFIEKLKSKISKKVFEESSILPLSHNEHERYTQLRFLTNACVDTMMDYLRGAINLSIDETCELIISMLKKFT